MLRRLAFSSIFILSACGGLREENHLRLTEKGITSTEIGAEPFHFRQGPLSPRTKIFLAAGSGEVSNFAWEIVDQKELWKKRGYAADEIACYYAAPDLEHYSQDKRRFDEVAPALADCYPAEVKLFRSHLQSVKGASDVYVYMTSHGMKPLGELLRHETDFEEQTALRQVLKLKPWLDQFFIEFGMLPVRRSAYSLVGLIRMTPDNIEFPQNIYLTPRSLRSALEPLATTRKTVVLQACYSGGFLGAPGYQDTLATLPKINVLTAAAWNRPSFGCSSGDKRTYYGQAVYDSLNEQTGKRFEEIDWKGLHQSIIGKVNEREAELNRESGEKYAPSLPQYSSSF